MKKIQLRLLYHIENRPFDYNILPNWIEVNKKELMEPSYAI